MSKVICEICGTTYQDTADCCPICGCSRDIASELAKEDFVVDGAPTRAGNKKREIFDFDEADTTRRKSTKVQQPAPAPQADDEEEDEPGQNTAAVVILTVLIVVLLCVTGFLFVKFFLPNMRGEEQQQQIPVQTAPVQTQPEVTVPETTTEPRIPCQSIALSSGEAQLTEAGSLFLLNVIKTPEDTTDQVYYTSEDESVAVVSEDGRVTAINEGTTMINITCGDQTIIFPVTVAFPEPTTEATVVIETEPAETVDPNLVLKLKKSDIRLQVYTYFTLQLDCELDPSQVEWSSEHPYIATVDENGVVTAIKSGITEVTAKYGGQEAKCIIRCYN